MIAYLIVFLYALAATLVSLHRFWQYEVFYFDFGIFDQAIWYASRLQAPIIEHLVVPGKWIFADHFSPTIFLLSPFYWLTNRQEMLLIAQAIAVSLSGLVLYRIGQRALKENILAFAVMVAYLLFVGLQNAIITDFHEVTLGTLPLMLLLWAWIARRKKLFWLLLIFTLGIKESTGILGATLGLSIIFTDKKWRSIGVGTLIISIAWALAATKFIIPFFSGGSYGYSPILPETFWGQVLELFNEPIKRKTLLYSFGSFSFLPLFYPPAWLLILQDFFIRFVPRNTNLRWDLGLHYSAQLAPILGWASIMTLAKMKMMQGSTRNRFLIASGIMLISISLHQFKLHGPLGLAYNPAFYAHTKNFTFLDALVSKVPQDGSVMAQNNLATRFSHQTVYLLRKNYWDYLPDYIVIDARERQNPNNFFGIKDYRGIENVEAIINSLKTDPNYEIIYQTDKQYVFKIIQR